MSRRKSKFAPIRELSLDELMPDRHELEQLSSDGKINPEAFAIRGEEASRLHDAVQKLPPQYRQIVSVGSHELVPDDDFFAQARHGRRGETQTCMNSYECLHC